MVLAKKILLLLLSLCFIGSSLGQVDSEDEMQAEDDLADDGTVQSAASEGDIMTALQAAGVTTFADFIEQVGIVDELDGGGTVDLEVLGGVGGGPYTVFAPTDEAFAMVPQDTLNNLMDSQDDLAAIIEHHVVDGTDIGEDDTIDAVEGGPIEITRSGDRITEIDGAGVVRTINYDNGVIYVIDRVLLPDDQNLIDEYGLDAIDWGNED